MASAPLIGIVGWSGAGKTTLIERLIAVLAERGLTVATIKHAHHALRPGDPGADGARHARAGSSNVVVIGPEQWEVAGVLQDSPPPRLEAAAARAGPVDLILVEGFKRAPIPKIEVRRKATSTQKPLTAEDPNVVAIASDDHVPAGDLPVFALDDVDAIAAFIAQYLGVDKRIDHLRPE